MGLLTDREKAVIRGKVAATQQEITAVKQKLRAFQITKTNADHVKRVNQFIDRADAESIEKALAEAGDGKIDLNKKDLYYHQAMNRMARAAGLRC